MAIELEAFGLLELLKQELGERWQAGLLSWLLGRGRILPAYCGAYRLVDHGTITVSLHLVNYPDKDWKLAGVDFHAMGRCVWELEAEQSLDPEENDPLRVACICKSPTKAAGLVLMELVNGDVLPSLAAGTRFKAQVCAVPLEMCLFRARGKRKPGGLGSWFAFSRDGMTNAQREYFGPGALMPLGVIAAMGPTPGVREARRFPPNAVYAEGTITALTPGGPAVNGILVPTYLRITVATTFGPLDVVVNKEMARRRFGRSGPQVGDAIEMICLISGDVAVEEYETGRIDDEDHLLALWEDACFNRRLERLRRFTAPSVAYVSEWNRHTWRGQEEVFAQIRRIHDTTSHPYIGQPGTVTATTQSAHEPRPPFPVGKRCSTWRDRRTGETLGTLFLTLDAHNRIARATVSQNPDYHVMDDVPGAPMLLPGVPRPRTHIPEDWPLHDKAIARAKKRIEALTHAIEAEGKAPYGGLRWLVEGWREPCVPAHLIFAFNGQVYAVLVHVLGESLLYATLGRRAPSGDNVFASPDYRMIPCAFDFIERRCANGTVRLCQAIPRLGLIGARPIDAKPRSPLIVGNAIPPEPCARWELRRLALQTVLAHLADGDLGFTPLNACDDLRVEPQLWVRDATGRVCWARVIFATSPEETQRKRHQGLENTLPQLRGNDGYLLTVHLPTFGTPIRGQDAAPVVDAPQRIYLAPN